MLEKKQRISKLRDLDRQLSIHKPGYKDSRFLT